MSAVASHAALVSGLRELAERTRAEARKHVQDVEASIAAHAAAPKAVRGADPDFQWPWTIASKGADHLANHTDAVAGMIEGGSAVATSPAGPGLIAAIKSDPSNSTATGDVMNDGIFSPALNSINADDLMRTLFIGFGGGGQVGFAGGSGGAGVGYDLVSGDTAAITYSAFELGVGVGGRAGLLVGAMTAAPDALNASSNLWTNGISLGVAAGLQVVMHSSDLSLIGFAVNVGAGAGVASTAGYGSISSA